MPWPLGGSPIELSLAGVEAYCDELRQIGACGVENAQRRVTSVYQVPGRFHDPLQHNDLVQVVCDRHHRVEQPSKLPRTGVLGHGPAAAVSVARRRWATTGARTRRATAVLDPIRAPSTQPSRPWRDTGRDRPAILEIAAVASIYFLLQT